MVGCIYLALRVWAAVLESYFSVFLFPLSFQQSQHACAIEEVCLYVLVPPLSQSEQLLCTEVLKMSLFQFPCSSSPQQPNSALHMCLVLGRRFLFLPQQLQTTVCYGPYVPLVITGLFLCPKSDKFTALPQWLYIFALQERRVCGVCRASYLPANSLHSTPTGLHHCRHLFLVSCSTLSLSSNGDPWKRFFKWMQTSLKPDAYSYPKIISQPILGLLHYIF